MEHGTVWCGTVRHSMAHTTARHSPARHSMAQCSPAQCGMARCGTACCSMVPCSMEWHGMVPHGAAWLGAARHNMTRHGTAQRGAPHCGTPRHATAQHSTTRHHAGWPGAAHHGAVRHNMVQCGTAQCGTAQLTTAQHGTGGAWWGQVPQGRCRISPSPPPSSYLCAPRSPGLRVGYARAALRGQRDAVGTGVGGDTAWGHPRGWGPSPGPQSRAPARMSLPPSPSQGERLIRSSCPQSGDLSPCWGGGHCGACCSVPKLGTKPVPSMGTRSLRWGQSQHLVPEVGRAPQGRSRHPPAGDRSRWLVPEPRKVTPSVQIPSPRQGTEPAACPQARGRHPGARNPVPEPRTASVACP